MDNIEYTRHNTETNKIKTNHRKLNRQQSWMDNIEYTRHNTETNKLKTKHRKLNRQQSWMDNIGSLAILLLAIGGFFSWRKRQAEPEDELQNIFKATVFTTIKNF
jgi:hypothetical protein